MLPDAPWRHRPGLDHLLDVLGAGSDEVRFVGGAVRDGLLNLSVNDIDLATIYPPQEVMNRLKQSEIKAVPTGLAHGTITAVVDGKPVEVTTLRCDVSTDGRRATIAYTDDWQADAARRDFTINALYARPTDGVISDYFGGIEDLRARVVRFIGDAETRIAEDHLRILRYFRFFARFGNEQPDPQAYAACRTCANSLMALSRERIADELLKLLALPKPAQAMTLMIDGAILMPVLPEITADGVDRLRELLDRERLSGLPHSALLRLCALLPRDPAIGEDVAARLKFSNKARKRIAAALGHPPAFRSLEELAYRVGVETAQDMILLDPDRNPGEAGALNAWSAPELPIGGALLMQLGMPAGPNIARALNEIRELWIAEGFPSSERTQEIAAQIVSKFHRRNQQA